MATNLSSLYGDITSKSDISALDTKVKNLSNITIKNNIANQTMLQPRITNEPTQDQNVIRLWDLKYTRIINHTNALNNPNTVWEWSGAPFQNQRLHSFVVKVAISGVDYLFDWQCYIENKTYKNMGPTFSFAKDNNLNETAKIKVWVEDNKFKMISSVGVASVLVYMRYDHHRN